MAMIRINGSLQPVPQAPEYDFTPQNGLSVTQRYECAGDNLRGLFAAYANLRVATNLVASPGKSILVARSSGPLAGQPETTTDTWQIMANEIQKDIFEHPTSLMLEELWPKTLSRVKDDLEKYNNRQDPGSPPPDPAAVTAGAGALFQLLIRGTTHYALGQYVLRHTTNVSNTYGQNVSDFNIERIYTTSQLLGEATNGNSWVFPLPGRMVNKIQNLAAPASRVGYLWGWRKLPSTETTTANDRIEITTEYWLEQWATYTYPVAVT